MFNKPENALYLIDHDAIPVGMGIYGLSEPHCHGDNVTEVSMIIVSRLLGMLLFFSLLHCHERLDLDKLPVVPLQYKGAAIAEVYRVKKDSTGAFEGIMDHLKGAGFNSIQLNSFGYMQKKEDVNIEIPHEGRRGISILLNALKLRKKGFSIMYSPHIWVGQSFSNYEGLNLDQWRNQIDFPQEEARKAWFRNYEHFILWHGKLATEMGAEIFVVGTELEKMVKYKAEWLNLIARVREVFKGKLTYAAEGWNVGNIPFWEMLDYIGVNAYFPLTTKAHPTLAELIDGWRRHEHLISETSKRLDLPVIFTEIGFKSVVGSAIKPWEWDMTAGVSEEAQAQAYQATMAVFSKRPYLHGVYIWKYFTSPNYGYEESIEKGFSPYMKKAEEVLQQWFGIDE